MVLMMRYWAYMFIMGILFYLMFGYFLPYVSLSSILIVLVIILPIFYLCIAVHELGHLLFGFISGYKFGYLTIGLFTIYKGNKKLNMTLKHRGLTGQCLMLPSDDYEKFKFVYYHLGGVVMNALFATVSMSVLIVRLNGYFATITLITFFMMNIVLILYNAVPNSKEDEPNDVSNVIAASKSSESKRGLFLIHCVESKFLDGGRFRDFDENIFKRKQNNTSCNFLVENITLFEARRLFDAGDYNAAKSIYTPLEYSIFPATYRNEAIVEFLYCCILTRDYDKAQDVFNENEALFSSNKLESSRLLAAYENFVLRKNDRCEELIAMAKKEARNIFIEGYRIMELDYILELERAIQESKEGSFA